MVVAGEKSGIEIVELSVYKYRWIYQTYITYHLQSQTSSWYLQCLGPYLYSHHSSSVSCPDTLLLSGSRGTDSGRILCAYPAGFEAHLLHTSCDRLQFEGSSYRDRSHPAKSRLWGPSLQRIRYLLVGCLVSNRHRLAKSWNKKDKFFSCRFWWRFDWVWGLNHTGDLSGKLPCFVVPWHQN